MTLHDSEDGQDVRTHAPGLRARLLGTALSLRVGLGLLVAGYLVLGYTWFAVASTLRVAEQLPYVVSGGFSGLGLVMTGLLLITVTVRRQASEDRATEMAQLIGTLHDLNVRLGAQQSPE